MLNEGGISAFVLHYRFEPYDCNAIVADIKRAVRWVRYHADKYNIAPDKIATLGFSAGGHLSALAATLFDSGLEEGDEIDRMSCRPDAAAFCYAVLTMNLDYGDDISRRVFIGDVEADGEIERLYSPYLNVRDDMPPVFMWHTSADPIVPVENPLRMAKELSAKKIPFELHVFPEGAHGLDLAKDIPGTCQWPTLAQNWFKRQGF
jgi:acetyl esterase/lipase